MRLICSSSNKVRTKRKKISTDIIRRNLVIKIPFVIIINYLINIIINYRRSQYYTDSTKINRPGQIIRKYWTNFWQPTAQAQQTIFEKTLIEVCSPHLYASFGTFCVQIGQLFVAQWVFKHSEEFRNQRHFASIWAISRFSNIHQRVTLPRIIDQFGRKRCQKKHKDVDYKPV